MASIKRLKKQITYLTEEVISNCYLASIFQGKEASEALNGIINEAAELHNKFRDAAIHCPKDANKKQYYAKLKADFINGNEDLFQKISNTCKKK